MTGRERFLKVMDGEKVDRVPVTLFIQGQGHFISQMYPEVDPWDFETIQTKVIEIQRQIGVDPFVRMLFFDQDEPMLLTMGGLNIYCESDNWEVTTKEIHKGDTLIKKSTIRTPEGTLTQDFSINTIREGTLMYACTEKPIKNMRDLEIASKYEPPISDSVKKKMKKIVSNLKKVMGEDGLIGAWTPGGLFNNISTLIDHTELYSLFITDYAFYKGLMEFAMKRVSDVTSAMEASGIDAFCIGGNVAGGFLGARFFEEYVLPFEKEYIAFCQRNGIPVIYHNCGELMNLVGSYKQLGCKVVEPFSPAPLGDGDLVKAHEIVNQAYTITGGVDQVNVLKNGTVDLVKEVTERTIQQGKLIERFILQSADFLEYGTPLENLQAYCDTAMSFANY